MNGKKITGIAVLVIGVILLAFSFYVKGRVAEVQEGVKEINKPNTRNPIAKAVGQSVQQKAEEKIQEYQTLVTWGMSVGGILVVIGAGMIFFWKKR